jgi:type III pantothenate kinase
MFIDIGNTNTKILTNTGASSSIDTKSFNIKYFLTHFKNDDRVVISSVVPSVLEDVKNDLNSMNRGFDVIDRNSPYSFNFEIEGIGVDRLLAVEGALTITKSPCVVIDAGTAVTVDFVNFKNNEACIEGGVIIPGFNLGLRSLSDYTSQLPELDPKDPKDLIGKNTGDAMLSGVHYTIVRGVEGLIDDVMSKLGINRFEIFITGGAGKVFKASSSKGITYVEDLVFKGMQNIAKRSGK